MLTCFERKSGIRQALDLSRIYHQIYLTLCIVCGCQAGISVNRVTCTRYVSPDLRGPENLMVDSGCRTHRACLDDVYSIIYPVQSSKAP